MLKGADHRAYRPSIRIRLRRTAGFALGICALALIDLRYHFLPRLTRRRKKTC